MSLTTSSEERTLQNATPSLSLNARARRFQRRQTFFIYGGRIFLLVALLVIWQLISGRLVNPLFISSPLAVMTQAIAWIKDGSL